MDLTFHPSAAKDARVIADKYSAISEKLGERFWAALDTAIDIIANYPERHHYDFSGLRRSNLKSFPYHILFEHRPDCLMVFVIRHHHRNPSYGLKRQ